LDYFKESEIGDVDGDGLREILDPWGNPIEFLRWAPGFVSDLQPHDPVASPDPFDPLDMDRPSGGPRENYRLVPLIYSAGPDGIYDVVSDDNPPISYATIVPRNDPYYTFGGRQLGEAVDVNSDGEFDNFDNVNNHFLNAN